MDVIGLSRVSESMCECDLCANPQACFDGCLGAYNQFVWSCESPAFGKFPRFAFCWLKRREEITVGRDDRYASVRISYLRGYGPGPGKTRNDLFVFLEGDRVSRRIGIEQSVEHRLERAGIATHQKLCVASASCECTFPRGSKHQQGHQKANREGDSQHRD